MNALYSFFFVSLVASSLPVNADSETPCPSGLPYELFRDCSLVTNAAQSDENGLNDFGPGYYGAGSYNVSEQLQFWVDRQMVADVPRDDAVSEDEGSVAQRQKGR